MTAALIQELAAAQEQAEFLGDRQTASLLARAAAELAARPTQGQIDAAVQRWDHWRARHDEVAAELAAMRRDAEWRAIETAPDDVEIYLWSEVTRRPVFLGCWGDYCKYNQPQITHWKPAPEAPPPPAQEPTP